MRIESMRLSAAVLCPLLLLLAVPVQAAKPSNAATQDQAPDADNPAINRQLLVPSHGEGMNALFFLASGTGPKPTVLLLHGLPGNEQNLDLAQAIRRAGWNVLTLHYRGSWGSPGKFSIAGAVEDAEAAMNFIRQPNMAANYSIDTQRLVIAGHSLGGYAAARYAATHDDIAGLILIDAWNAGEDAKQLRANPSERAAFAASFDDLGNSLKGADAETLTSELETLGDDLNLVSLAPGLARHPTLSVWADKGEARRNAALAGVITALHKGRLSTANLPSDHSFSDHRIALAQEVVNWLEVLAKPSP
jgi:pimeloyl-ACP methyl ester carboxylesterase